jgi:hypothetical protein
VSLYIGFGEGSLLRECNPLGEHYRRYITPNTGRDRVILELELALSGDWRGDQAERGARGFDTTAVSGYGGSPPSVAVLCQQAQ